MRKDERNIVTVAIIALVLVAAIVLIVAEATAPLGWILVP